MSRRNSFIYSTILILLFTSVSISQEKVEIEEMLKWFPYGDPYENISFADFNSAERAPLYTHVKDVLPLFIASSLKISDIPLSLINESTAMAAATCSSNEQIMGRHDLKAVEKEYQKKMKELSKSKEEYQKNKKEIVTLSKEFSKNWERLAERKLLMVIQYLDAEAFLQKSAKAGDLEKTAESINDNNIYLLSLTRDTPNDDDSRPFYLLKVDAHTVIAAENKTDLNRMFDSGQQNTTPMIHSEIYKDFPSRISGAGQFWKYDPGQASLINKKDIMADLQIPREDIDEEMKYFDTYKIYGLEEINIAEKIQLKVTQLFSKEEHAIKSAGRALQFIYEMGGEIEKNAGRLPKAFKESGIDLSQKKKRQVNFGMMAIGNILKNFEVNRDDKLVWMETAINEKQLKGITNFIKIGAQMAKTRREIIARQKTNELQKR